MSQNLESVIQKLIDINGKQNPIFQTGTTSSTGHNKVIQVVVGNKRVNALAWNIKQPGQVTVFWDEKNKRYVTWEGVRSGSGGKRTTTLALRKTRPSGGVENYNFIVGQDGGLLEGFGKDKNLSTDVLDLSGYEVIGITNKGDNVVLILQKDDMYLFINGLTNQSVILLNSADFEDTIIPSFTYKGIDILYNKLVYHDDRFKQSILTNGLFSIASGVEYPKANYYADDSVAANGEISQTRLTIPTIVDSIPVNIGPIFYYETLILFTPGTGITLYNSPDRYMRGVVTGTQTGTSTGVAIYVDIQESVGAGQTASPWNLSITTASTNKYDQSIHYSSSALFNPYHLSLHPFLVYNPDEITEPYSPLNWKDIDLVKTAGFMRSGEYAVPNVLSGNMSASPFNYGDTLADFKARNPGVDSFTGVTASTSTIVTINNKSLLEDRSDNKSQLVISLSSNYTANNVITGLFVDTMPSPDIIFWNVALTETLNRTKVVTRTDAVTIPLTEVKVLPESALYEGNVITSSSMTMTVGNNLTYQATPPTDRVNATYQTVTSGSMTLFANGDWSNTWSNCFINLHEQQIPTYINRSVTIAASGSKNTSGSVTSSKTSVKDINDIQLIFKGSNASLCQKTKGKIQRTKTIGLEDPALSSLTSVPSINNSFEEIDRVIKSYLLVTESQQIEYSLYGAFFAIKASSDTDAVESYNIGCEGVQEVVLKVYPKKTDIVTNSGSFCIFTNNGGSIYNTPVVGESTEIPVTAGGFGGNPFAVTPTVRIDDDESTYKTYMVEYAFAEEEYLDNQDKLLFFKCTGTTSYFHPFQGFGGGVTAVYHVMNPDATSLFYYAGRELRCKNYLAGDRQSTSDLFVNQYSPIFRFYPWVLDVTLVHELYEDEELASKRGQDPSDIEIYVIENRITKVATGSTTVEWVEKEEDYVYSQDYEWYVDNKEYEITSLPTTANEFTDAGFYLWSNIYPNKTIVVSEGNHGLSLLKYLETEEGMQTANLYTVTDENGNETVEIAIAQIPTTTTKQRKHYADIYRFNTTTLKWERRPNAVSPLSKLTNTSDFISYHPKPINKKRTS